MFTLENIIDAQAQFTGPDFPKLIVRFKEIGMVKNHVDILAGQVIYRDKTDSVIVNQGYQVKGTLADLVKLKQAKNDLQTHQAGQTDFPTFCEDMAKSGIVGWVIDLEEMTCSYLNKDEQAVLVENIPTV
jgi:uncharacterized protein YbcV (DUF1398 family)